MNIASGETLHKAKQSINQLFLFRKEKYVMKDLQKKRIETIENQLQQVMVLLQNMQKNKH